MPKRTVIFAHSHGDKVKILALDKCIGIVESLSESVLGKDYRVAYWNDGRRYSEWLREEEIASVE